MDEQNQLKLFGQGGLVFDTNQPVLSSLALLPGIGLGAKAFPYALKGAKAIPGLFKSAGPKPMVGKYGSTRYLNQPAGPLNFAINNPVAKNPYLSLGIPAAGARFFSQSSPQNVLDTLPDQINLQPLNYSGDFSVVDSKLPEPFMQSNIPNSPNLLDEQFNLVNKPKPEVITPEVITPEVIASETEQTKTQDEQLAPEKTFASNKQIANMLFYLSDVFAGRDPGPGLSRRLAAFQKEEEEKRENIRRENALAMVDNIVKDLPADSPLRKRINMIDQFSEIDPYGAASAAINLVEQNEQEKQAKTDYISFVQSLGLDDSQTTTFEKLPIDLGYKIAVDMAYGKSEPTAAMQNANEFLKVQEAFNNNEISENVYNSLKSIYGADRGRGKTRKEYVLEFVNKIYLNEYLDQKQRDSEIEQFEKALDRYFPDSVTTSDYTFTTSSGKYQVKPLQG
jgi:hypothetical protein